MTAPMLFVAIDWYWIVNNSITQVYSSKVSDYISSTDPTYLAWRNDSRQPIRVASEEALGRALAPYRLRPIQANVLNGYLDESVSYFDFLEQIHRAAALVVMDEDNRLKTDIASMASAVAAATSLADLKVRFAAIAFTPQRTAAQIKSAIRARLGT